MAFHVPWCRKESNPSTSPGLRPKYKYGQEDEDEDEDEKEDEKDSAFDKKWAFDPVHSKLQGR
ncbi:MAG: hypothetical protein P1U77_24530 [Rubripirellula sp.]|nr:hypothetical protein [Rubripirellula sp.]